MAGDTPDTAVAIAAGVKAGGLDPVAVTEQCLTRIAHIDPQLGAFATVRADQARAEASALRGRELTDLPLAGVPLAVKDVVPVEGLPMRSGSAATDPRPQPLDDPMISSLRCAGAVIIGTTETCEAGLWPTVDRPGRIVRNPWDLELSSGGSSGGSASAVAAGLVPIATGTDCLGSIRIPASACGLVGVKPSRGLLAGDESLTRYWFGLGERGVLATTVADAALLLSVLANQSPSVLLPRLDDRVDLPRLGVVTRNPLDGSGFAPATVRALLAVVQVLTDVGCTATEIHWARSWSAVAAGFGYWCAAARAFADDVPVPAALQTRTRTMARLGGLARPMISRVPLTRWEELASRMMGGYDILVMPTFDGGPCAALTWSKRGAVSNMRGALSSNRGLTPLWNMSGNPVVVVPAPAEGPNLRSRSGVQLVGRRGHDAWLLSLAAAYEARSPWPRTAGAITGHGS